MKLDHCLYGYRDGHEMLAASRELTPDEKNVLLFQTDLSGSNMSEGFKSYVTGFALPKSNTYILSKTWYADEMKRPGCVWTHVLLIPFSELGKIAELTLFLKLFRRPIVDRYDDYSVPLQLEEVEYYIPHDFIDEGHSIDRSRLTSCLYHSYNKTIIVPSYSSIGFESLVLSIWSDQWPRLRRNFSFCTGALSLRSVEGREFDLQVVPVRNVNAVERISKRPLVFDVITYLTEELSLRSLTGHKKNNVRKFFWQNGADIKGSRKNFIPLLKIYEEIDSLCPSLPSLLKLLLNNFSDKDIARTLKKRLFGQESLLASSYTEAELVGSLLTLNSHEVDSLGDLQLLHRAGRLINSGELTLSKIFTSGLIGREISKDAFVFQIFELVDHNYLQLELISNPELLESLAHTNPSIARIPNLWRLNFTLQRRLIDGFSSVVASAPLEDITYCALANSSSEISYLRRKCGDVVTQHVLVWLNVSSELRSLMQWLTELVANDIEFVNSWIMANEPDLTDNFLQVIVRDLDVEVKKSLAFSVQIWARCFKFNLSEVKKIEISIICLNVILSRKIVENEDCLVDCFDTVFKSMNTSSLSVQLWSILPHESYFATNDESEIGLYTKSMRELQSSFFLDQKEILVRTVVNKFIQYDWSVILFVRTFDNLLARNIMFRYSYTFPEGRNYLHKVNQFFDSRM